MMTERAVETELKALLETESVMDIEFVKANGDVRKMQVTRKPENIGVEHEYTDSTSERHQSPDTQVVWSVLDGNWRSFRWDRLNSYKVVVDA